MVLGGFESHPSVDLGYFRTWYGNFLVTDNRAITPGDFDPYCLAAPADARLPNAGQSICGFYDIKPASFGLTNNFITKASNFGDQKEIFNGVDLTGNARLRGLYLFGGVSAGSTLADSCFVVDSPQASFSTANVREAGFYQCRNRSPWSAGTQLKVSAIYTLPWQIRTSVTYQNVAGIPLTARYVASNAAMLPSLGRDLGSCRGAAVCNGTTTVDLIEHNTIYREGRNTQANIRLARMFHLRGLRMEPQFDVFNLFNSNQVLVMTTRYGAAWQNANSILAPRVFKLGVH